MHSSTPIALWVATAVGLIGLFAVDLVLTTRRRGPLTVRQAASWLVVYVAAALAFGLALLVLGRGQQSAEYLAGYVTEYSLSVDNLFVFALILTRFAVPEAAREKVLLIGIVMSLALRAVFIVAGVSLLSAISWSFCAFGLLLLVTAFRLVRDSDDVAEVGEYRTVRALRRVVPISPSYDGAHLRVVIDGRRYWTPLLLTVAAIAVANFVFALDSMPAIFGLTQDTFVILTANAFALLGLRQLFFVIDGLLERLPYLNYGLAVILGFIGLKLVDEGLIQSGVDHLGSWTLPEVGILPSLGFIVVVLLVAAAAGARPRRGEVAD